MYSNPRRITFPRHALRFAIKIIGQLDLGLDHGENLSSRQMERHRSGVPSRGPSASSVVRGSYTRPFGRDISEHEGREALLQRSENGNAPNVRRNRLLC